MCWTTPGRWRTGASTHEPPFDLPDARLAARVRTDYGLAVDEIAFLPLGRDSSAWVYRVRAEDGAVFFLKVRLGPVNQAGLLVPRYLHEHGVAPVVAPLPTATRRLWTTADGYTLTLYPFVAGTTGMMHGMAQAQWIAYGAALRRIHEAALPPEIAQLMRHETYVPSGADLIRVLEARIGGASLADPAAQELATFWQEQQEIIHTLVERAEDLGQRLAYRTPPQVLCHADIHTNNVLLDAEGQVWIVDWDETMLAPRERDVMFAVGGGINRMVVGPREEELFLRGYGDTALDPIALAFYRYAWAVSDIGDYADQIIRRPDLGAISKRAALETFMTLFQPGSIVALALAATYRDADHGPT
jgi:spectinomycin phosphotransferase